MLPDVGLLKLDSHGEAIYVPYMRKGLCKVHEMGSNGRCKVCRHKIYPDEQILEVVA